MTGTGINTVRINGVVKAVTELDPVTLSNEWSKLKNENDDLYSYNRQINQGWRCFILRLLGIHLPDKNRVRLEGINARKESVYPE
ncbi:MULTISPECIES: hypothetical protein [Enterobacteriaceae]|uniref:Uncharacterized protein n=1 Tax=Citrobacter telavivensis TaxID=2653932 RepID=A0A6L5EFE5_9ENTR|nr:MULTISPECIES: hypothetical protein [Enterobacteriaceae]HDR2614743.1 hypothetical protein [Enterobacter ludwigii]MDT7093081.1 hypothetical protein [Citrobacter freundii]MPQ54199.1 hypothetical protein [Citrobacter telavivensis]QFS69088.1 hypothetical protein GBC03_01805 [Citrobacter telavivensis]QMT09074.1 hypothetical protein H1R18_26120 [Enterobacter kobei]